MKNGNQNFSGIPKNQKAFSIFFYHFISFHFIPFHSIPFHSLTFQDAADMQRDVEERQKSMNDYKVFRKEVEERRDQVRSPLLFMQLVNDILPLFILHYKRHMHPSVGQLFITTSPGGQGQRPRVFYFVYVFL